MKLTVLGKYGPFPAAGGACSSYLLECGSTRLLIDFGSGAMGRLVRFAPKLKLDAILLSHLHSDHMADMLVLRYALQQYSSRGMESPMPLTVLAPDEPELEYRQLSGSGVFDMIPIRDGMRARFGSVSCTFTRVLHPVPTYCMDIRHNGKKLFYTGDTGLMVDLASLAADADMLLADTAFLSADKTTTTAPHLTAKEAGALAREAGAKRLLCSHIWGGGYTDEQILSEARLAFPEAEVAEELRTYEF